MEENKLPQSEDNQQEKPSGNEATPSNSEESKASAAPEKVEETTPESTNENKYGASAVEEVLSDVNKSFDDKSGNPYAYRAKVDVTPVQEVHLKVASELKKIIVGQDELIELLMVSVFCGGHCLLEGLPGIAKTLTAKSLASAIDTPFSRIQFTPDLMPTDVSGTTVFNLKESAFHFKKGPIFSSVILIDEINRAPAKTQASLMEVMEEKQLTYDGVTYPMMYPFFVIATQNPIEQEGTYTLPEAQLDRFLFRVKLGYPDLEDEKRILELFERDFFMQKTQSIEKVTTPEEIKQCQDLIQQVYVKPELLNYIAAIIHNTRNNGDLYLGASPRASLAIMRTSKAIAAMRGRDFVTPDDIQMVCTPILNHRIILSHEREMEGTTTEDVIKEILSSIEVPR